MCIISSFKSGELNFICATLGYLPLKFKAQSLITVFSFISLYPSYPLLKRMNCHSLSFTIYDGYVKIL